MKNKDKILNGGQKKTVFGGPRTKKARKTLRKAKTNFLKVILVSIINNRVQMVNITRTKEEVRIRREKEKKVPLANQEDFLPQKHLVGVS